jgi:hypothetical protein
MSKNLTEFNNRSLATKAKNYLKVCLICKEQFFMAKNQKYCSPQCKGKVQYVNGSSSTENQYQKINGNWKKYSQRLLYFGGRRRDKLTWQIIFDKIKEQNYKCALSGVDLTCYLEKGKKIHTNASVDRIVAGGPYTKDNIQIVCSSLNKWRADQSIDDFVDWCKKVVDYHNLINKQTTFI